MFLAQPNEFLSWTSESICGMNLLSVSVTPLSSSYEKHRCAKRQDLIRWNSRNPGAKITNIHPENIDDFFAFGYLLDINFLLCLCNLPNEEQIYSH